MEIQSIQLESVLTKKEVIPGLDVWFGSLIQPNWIKRRLKEYLLNEEKERAKQFIDQKSRSRYIISRGLLRWIIGKYINDCPENIMFKYNPYGKPYLDEIHRTGISFNLSHSHDYLCIAIGSGKDIGIDVEFVRQLFNFISVIDYIFTEREKQTFLTLEHSKQCEFFYEVWVRKEAFVKAIGKGLSYSLTSFDVLDLNIEIKAKNGHLTAWEIKELNLDTNYKAAVCYRNI
ncbi:MULTISPECIES: 4'-phosphopantetheinyl transferase family protein [Peribacillus]|uniref:4'-phosphopantetheinyl transferase family protein n=1 Tax=Peribacillus TaxID=2675229 RepID=UPI0024C1C1BA|nr:MULTISPECIES: 4'-phosphopantetheinyl transferase superfamily protein [Peribacillus]MED3993764.1 4'-phosphopantetheinyl transferase superfamily protein [Peribacillus frigoritolerans]WHY59331.1 4'-phosphopantetheinyl transferase superfamily protein [Peribacillus simplex]